jgi:hypothetical protein
MTGIFSILLHTLPPPPCVVFQLPNSSYFEEFKSIEKFPRKVLCDETCKKIHRSGRAGREEGESQGPHMK